MKLMHRRRGQPHAITTFRQEMDDLWSRFFDGADGPFETHLPEAFTHDNLPPVNIAEDEGTFTVSIDLPGVEAKDVDVEVVGRDLVISGERKWESKKTEKDYVRVESQFGSFRRVIPLPTNLRTASEDIEAKQHNGTLTIRLKKLEPTPIKKIPVKST